MWWNYGSDKNCFNKTPLTKIFLTKNVATIFNENFYNSLAFLLITISLLVIASMKCCLLRHWSKQNIYNNITTQ